MRLVRAPAQFLLALPQGLLASTINGSVTLAMITNAGRGTPNLLPYIDSRS